MSLGHNRSPDGTAILRVAQGCAFLCLFLLGLVLYKDYGIAYDEPVNRRNGGISFNAVVNGANEALSTTFFENDPETKQFNVDLNQYRDRDYGVAFDLPVFFLERILGINDSRGQYQFRHILTFLAFLAGVAAVYRIALLRFSDWRLASVAAVMLMLSPRMFAEAFYNNKDIVFMAAYAVAGYTLLKFIFNPTLGRGVVHGLASAVAIDIRIMAVMIPLATVVLLGGLALRGELRVRRVIPMALCYALATMMFVYLLWPWLWAGTTEGSAWLAPFRKVAEVFGNMSSFRWSGWIQFAGHLYPAGALPKYYLPVWIAVTTPVLYLALCGVGIVATLLKALRCKFRLWDSEEELQDLVFLAFATLPIVAVIVLNSVVYDGWRQVYFVYPWIILLAARGLTAVFNVSRRPAFRYAICAILMASCLHTAYWMKMAHPYQNVYFNALAGDRWDRKYEMDYWGLSNLAGLQEIARRDSRANITIAHLGISSVNQALLMLPPGDRERIKIIDDPGHADYLVTNYRVLGTTDAETFARLRQDVRPYFEIQVDDKAIYSVFKADQLPR